MDDIYLTINQQSVVESKVKGSRFIARTFIADTVDAALAQLDQTRRQEHAATHNCFAYIVGAPAEKAAFKYSDDGEPNGTAGRPIYDAIAGKHLTNILLVVTRYFGGTKLGTGGLARAYAEAARLAIDKSGVKENFITTGYLVEAEIAVYDSLVKILNRLGATQTDSQFSDRVTLRVQIRKSKADRLVDEITALSRGKAKIERIES